VRCTCVLHDPFSLVRVIVCAFGGPQPCPHRTRQPFGPDEHVKARRIAGPVRQNEPLGSLHSRSRWKRLSPCWSIKKMSRTEPPTSRYVRVAGIHTELLNFGPRCMGPTSSQVKPARPSLAWTRSGCSPKRPTPPSRCREPTRSNTFRLTQNPVPLLEPADLHLHGRGRSRPRSHHGLGFD
jgi:hypothetical protein